MSDNHPGSPGDGSQVNGDHKQDKLLPISSVSRIMKKAVPDYAKIAEDAKETVQESASEFIGLITNEAVEKCEKEQRSRINGDDLIWAMSNLGFDDYLDPLKIYLSRYRKVKETSNSLPSIDKHQIQSLSDGSHENGDQSPRSNVDEQNNFLPISIVSRIMKKALPDDALIAEDVKETVQECVTEFICLITNEAAEKCKIEQRAINGDDLILAMSNLGFEHYHDLLKVYLTRYREIEDDIEGGSSKEEDHNSQIKTSDFCGEPESVIPTRTEQTGSSSAQLQSTQEQVLPHLIKPSNGIIEDCLQPAGTH